MSTSNTTSGGLTSLLNEIKELVKQIKQELEDLKNYVES